MHLDSNLPWTLNGKITEVTEYSIQFDEKFVLLHDSRLIKDSLFCTFSVSVAKWDNFMGLNYHPT
jgi:hypothetical protein